MEQALSEVMDKHISIACSVSVGGIYQRRGHTSLNGCVSVISIDNDKLLGSELMPHYCRICESDYNNTRDYIWTNHKG